MFSGSLKLFHDEDDNPLAVPANTSSHLSNLFGTSMQFQDDADGATLKYIPPKPKQQTPNPVKPEPQPSWTAVTAKVVTAFKLVNQENISQGKVGLALLKSDNNYKIILYRSKQNVLSTINLQETTKLLSLENNYVQFWDDANELWSILFSATDYSLFVDEINGKCLIEFKSQAPQAKPSPTPADVTIPENLKDSHSHNEIETVSKTKANILSRMAKMGQPLPNLIASTTDMSSDSDNIASEEASTSPINKPAIYPRASRMTKPFQMVPVGQAVAMPSHGHQYGNNFVGQLPSASTPTMLPYGAQFVPADNLGVYFSESRTHNSEVRTYLSKLETKVEKILDRIDLVKSGGSSNTDRVYEDRIFELEKSNLYLKEQLRDYENRLNVNINGQEVKDLREQLEALKSTGEIKETEILNLKTNLTCETTRCEKLLGSLEELKSLNSMKIAQIAEWEEIASTKTRAVEEISTKYNDLCITNKTQEIRIEELEHEVAENNENFKKLNEKLETNKINNDDNTNKQDVKDLVKTLMSNLYEDLSTRLSEQDINQKDLMKVIGRVIREKTLEALK